MMLSAAMRCKCPLQAQHQQPSTIDDSEVTAALKDNIMLHSATVDYLQHVITTCFAVLGTADRKSGAGTCLSQDRSCSNDGGPGIASHYCLTAVLAEGFGQLITIHQQVVW